MTYHLEFTEKDVSELRELKYKHPHPRVQLKAEVLWLKYKGRQHQEIAEICEICQNTMLQYFKDFKDGGIEKIKEINFYTPESEMAEFKGTIEEYFQKNPPIDLKEAQHKIKELTGISRSTEQVRIFLRKIGMRKIKTGTIPKKADPEKQEDFLKRRSLNQNWKKQNKGNG